MLRSSQLQTALAIILIANSSFCSAQEPLEYGFTAADADRSGSVSAQELKQYLADRIQDESLRHKAIFEQIDSNTDKEISESEFEERRAAIEHVMGTGYLGDFSDPGKDYVLWNETRRSTNDSKIMAAVIHRFEDLTHDPSVKWPKLVDLSKVPRSTDQPIQKTSPPKNRAKTKDLIHATVILCGGSGMGFFTSGGVLISEDGHILTNYHVAEFLAEGKMGALTTDGKCHPVAEFLAGNQDRDVALIRIRGKGFKHINVASEETPVGGNLEMIHHSENRFFTYDRGYVMRYPTLGSWPWMEISADYAPGGSGCGIYNDKRELIGLVSIIQYGDGPSLALELDMTSDDMERPDEGSGEMQSQDTMLLVKHAVPLSAIRSLWKTKDGSPAKTTTTRTRKAVRRLESTDMN